MNYKQNLFRIFRTIFLKKRDLFKIFGTGATESRVCKHYESLKSISATLLQNEIPLLFRLFLF